MPTKDSVFAAAVRAAISGATVVTGNRRAARHIMAAAEDQLRQERKGWRTPDVLPLEAWLRRTWTESQLAAGNGAPLALLNGAQAEELWERIVVEAMPGIPNPLSTARTAAEAWRLAHDYGIAINSRDFAACDETRAFQSWAEKFSRRCTRQGWMDAAQLTATVAGLLPAIAAELRPCFAVYGFDELTPAQQKLFAALMAAGKQVEVLALSNQDDRAHARLVEAANPREELFAAARWATARVRGNSSARIGVVVTQMAELRAELEMVFTEVLHPDLLFTAGLGAERAFDLSLGKPLDTYPVVRCALLAIQSLLATVSVHEATVLLRSPYLAGGVAEAGARARIALTVRKKLEGSASAKELSALLGRSGVAPVLAAALNAAQRETQDTLQRARNGRLRPNEWATALRRMLDAMGWARPLAGDREFDSVEFQTLSSWTSLLETLASLDAVVPWLETQDLLVRLQRMAAEQLFQPENINAPVQIMGLLEAAGSTFDHLWTCGTTDDKLPAHAPPNPFLPVEALRRTGVPHASSEQELTFAETVLRRLLSSAEEVVFSWPRREDDRDLRPSPLAAGLTRGKIEEVGAGPATPRWEPWPRSEAREKYPAVDAPPAPPREIQPGGTSLFELQSNCPFRAFAELRLGAGQAASAEIGLSPLQRGHIVERALELVWLQLRDWFTLQNIAANDLEKLVNDSGRQAIAEEPDAETEFARRCRQIEEQRVAQLVKEWLNLERTRESFKVVAHQQKVVLEAGGIRVKGRIDRIDQTQDGHLVVIDYKTGKGQYSPSDWSNDRPRKPQLPLYATSLTKPLSGVAFALVRPGDCKLTGHADRAEVLGPVSARKRKDDVALPDRVAGWRGALTVLGQQYAAGKATVDPLDKACDYCHLQALCRVAEQERTTGDDEVNEDANE